MKKKIIRGIYDRSEIRGETISELNYSPIEISQSEE